MIERASRYPIAALLLMAIATAVVLAGCGSESQPEPTSTPNIPATVRAAVAQALGTPVAQPVGVRPGYCGRLYDGYRFWPTADLSDVQSEFDMGVDVNANAENGWTPLHFATAYQDADIVSLLLEAGANANARTGEGSSPLFLAIFADPADPNIVASLLDHGADVNSVGIVGELSQLTLLHFAVILASYDIVQILLDHGADVAANNTGGSTPLHFASQADDHNLIALLLDRGAAITAETRDGETPLHFAAVSDKPANVQLLLDRGANTSERNSKRQTPCESAVEIHNICREYRRNSNFNPVAIVMCESNDPEQEPRREEIISLLCSTSDIQATIDAAVATAMQETTAMPEGVGESGPTLNPTIISNDSIKQWSEPPPQVIDVSAPYTAVLQTSAGSITVELVTSEAPYTVNNFVFLARQGFYESMIFHRTIEGFMIQGGDPTGTGGGGPGYSFADEPVQRAYSRGAMAMANAGPNTNGSQFFIMHADYPLPPNYTIFGQVVAGMETVDTIASAPTQPGGEGSTPVNPVVIQSVEIVGP